jgi:hypothetical protein
MGQSKAHQWSHVLLVVLRATLRPLGDAHLAPDYKRAAIGRLDTYMDTWQQKGVTASTATP